MSIHTEVKKVTTHTLQEMKRKGEKISTIARKYGVTVADLKSWNSIGKKGIKAGKRLVVYVRQEVELKLQGAIGDDAPETQVAALFESVFGVSV